MLSLFKSAYRQSFNIAAPSLTEKNLPDQTGRVALITGGYAGVGQELSRILYQHNGTVYIAGRSSEKATKSINDTRALFPDSKGKIEFIQLDLADLTTIKGAAEDFLRKEERLDVLVNNAGVMIPPVGSKTTQGYELQMGTNVLGPWLFTDLLEPVLVKTAKTTPAGNVRVLWAGSLVVDVGSPSGGVQFDENGAPKVHGNPRTDYGQSKAANVLLSREYAKRHAGKNVISAAFNPGNLQTELQRHTPFLADFFGKRLLYHKAIYGAYTELWAGWSEDVKSGENGKVYAVPWGRDGLDEMRPDVVRSLDEGEVPRKLWDWCVGESKAFR